MKNFKLLLATTAILSTGLAMGVMADDEPETADMNVKVEIVEAGKIRVIQHIDFGKVLNGSFEMDMDPLTGNISGSSYPITATQNGIVMLASATYYGGFETISLPASVTLTDGKGHELQFTPKSGVISEDAMYDSIGRDVTYGIGGKLKGNLLHVTGIFTGEFTITAVADPGE